MSSPLTESPDAAPNADARLPVLRSEDILRGLREVAILHEEKLYRLSVTRQGKLILTK